MHLKSWFRGWRFASLTFKAQRSPRVGRKAFPYSTLRLEALEERVVPTTNTWITLSGGDWATGSNWSLGHSPLSTEDAVIPALNSGASVTHLTGTDTVHGLTLG